MPPHAQEPTLTVAPHMLFTPAWLAPLHDGGGGHPGAAVAEDCTLSSRAASDVNDSDSIATAVDPATGAVHRRPNLSYSAIIEQAIRSTPAQRMRLPDIYRYVAKHFPYFRLSGKDWKALNRYTRTQAGR